MNIRKRTSKNWKVLEKRKSLKMDALFKFRKNSECEGFEPPVALATAVFQTGAINQLCQHSSFFYFDNGSSPRLDEKDTLKSLPTFELNLPIKTKKNKQLVFLKVSFRHFECYYKLKNAFLQQR